MCLQAVLNAVEVALGLELELLIEFTALITWNGGSCIDWHTDSNRQALASILAFLTVSTLFYMSAHKTISRKSMVHRMV